MLSIRVQEPEDSPEADDAEAGVRHAYNFGRGLHVPAKSVLVSIASLTCQAESGRKHVFCCCAYFFGQTLSNTSLCRHLSLSGRPKRSAAWASEVIRLRRRKSVTSSETNRGFSCS